MNRVTRIAAVAVAIATALVGLGSAPAANAAGVRYLDEVFGQYVSRTDIVYGHAVNHTGALQALTLDVHEPARDAARVRAAIVWVHGGYFKEGNKEDYKGTWQQFVKAGYVTVSINYRLAGDELPYDILPGITDYGIDKYIDVTRDAQHDAQAAIRWVRAHASELRVDPERVAIVGHSAGGITANMVAFNDHDPGSSGNPGYSSRPNAAVAMAGASLPVKMTRVDIAEPPLLVVHGAADLVVPIFANASCAASIAMGNVCELVLDPDQDHGTFGHAQIREFLYRWLYARPALQLPTKVTIVGLESLSATLGL